MKNKILFVLEWGGCNTFNGILASESGLLEGEFVEQRTCSDIQSSEQRMWDF